MGAAGRGAIVASTTREGTVNTLLTVVAFILVIAVLALCAWAFVLAPFVVPRRHLHHP